MISENLSILHKRIKQACLKCGRKTEDVLLVAVSKNFSPENISEAVLAGHLDFGENYVQELNEKYQALINKPIKWHFVGHLQSNKVKYIANYIHLIHSVDSLNLAKEIDKRAKQHKRTQDVLVEVKTTSENTKYGIEPDNVIPLLRNLGTLTNVNVCGLMTMGPMSENPEDSRSSFKLLRELKDDAEKEGFQMKHLSMGMTNDFEVAIEEGATIIRVGTAIFGSRVKN